MLPRKNIEARLSVALRDEGKIVKMKSGKMTRRLKKTLDKENARMLPPVNQFNSGYFKGRDDDPL